MEHLYDKLLTYGKGPAYPFHMPGHKRQVEDFCNPFAIDITEIDGFDNLHHPEEILKEVQEKANRIYQADETFYLVNGSTCGILSAVSALVPPGGEILMARNCHKAAYHGCYLGNLTIHYLYPQYEPKCGINGGILPEDVENSLNKYPNIRAVLITSPTYDGAVSQVEAIAKIAHRHGIPLIVDEAHGAHFGFHPYFPKSAVHEGADVVIHSLHKTLPSLTQTGLLHVCGALVDRDRIRRFLGIYQTSSPSYVFMAAMDRCMDFLEQSGCEAFETFSLRLKQFYDFSRKLTGIWIPDYEIKGKYGIVDFDRSKLILACQKGGEWLYQKLRTEYGLQLEMAAGGYALALTSVMDTEEGFLRLEKALEQLDKETFFKMETLKCYEGVTRNETVLSIRKAYDCEKEEIALENSEGEISGEFLYLYPPGIPLLVPGERITREVLERVNFYKSQGLSLQGMKDYRSEKIQVVRG